MNTYHKAFNYLLIPAFLFFNVIGQAKVIVKNAEHHDKSQPLRRLIHQKKTRNHSKNHEMIIEIPNGLINERGDKSLQMQAKKPLTQTPKNLGSNGLATDDIYLSIDGFTADDSRSVTGFGPAIPPDTNGDVGNNYYIQFVNTPGWLVNDKNDGSRVAGPFDAGDIWLNFSEDEVCENGFDPVVLYDKLAQRWLFSYVSIAPDGRDSFQCFAISATSDPLGAYHRYKYSFDGNLNDFPHIGIWNDASGQRSGYYMVTHDFNLKANGGFGEFLQASFTIFERDKMLNGENARMVRLKDTYFYHESSIGAQPAHLESNTLPKAGQCNPFIKSRPFFKAYQVTDVCVDWANPELSYIVPPTLIGAGTSWVEGPYLITQPGTDVIMTGTSGRGQINYRASYRAYPDDVPLDDSLVVTFTANVNEQSAVRWAQIDFPEKGLPHVADQGQYAPDSTDRILPSISIDQDGNLGAAYTIVSSENGIFPGVAYTTRHQQDIPGTLRQENICVDGGGFDDISGRWGDYSSMSVDPVDECTFWSSMEYQRTSGSIDWSNRICAFTVENCGQASVINKSVQTETINVCTLNQDRATFAYQFESLHGYQDNIVLSVNNLPAQSAVTYSQDMPITTLPATGTFTVTGLSNFQQRANPITLTVTGDEFSKDFYYQLNLSNDTLQQTAQLQRPMDNESEVNHYSSFQWSAIENTDQYLLEIATDDNFNDIIRHIITDQANHTLNQPLESGHRYYWRVAPYNSCGKGQVSIAQTFTTKDVLAFNGLTCPPGSSTHRVFFDNMDEDTTQWSRPNAVIGTNTWQKSDAQAFSGQAWHAISGPETSDQYLVTPPITLPYITEKPLSLSFWQHQSLENNFFECLDAAIIEISTDGGQSYQQIDYPELKSIPYHFTVNNTDDNHPLAGSSAWCANPLSAQMYELQQPNYFTAIDLTRYAGQTVHLRFRLATDANTRSHGWYIDQLSIQSCR